MEFCQHIVDHLKLKRVQVIQDRVERLAREAEFREKFDWAIARAVARFSTLAEYMLPFVRVGGGMLALKGEQGPFEAQQAHQAVSVLGVSFSKSKRSRCPV